jgi:hypothetical protein
VLEITPPIPPPPPEPPPSLPKSLQWVLSFGLAKELTATVYESHTKGNSKSCLGKACFHDTFLVCMILSFVTAALACVLWARLRGKRHVR